MNKTNLTLIFLAFLCLGIATNPSPQAHKDELKQKVLKIMREEYRKEMITKNEPIESQGFSDLIMTYMASGIIDTYANVMEHQNYYVFSYLMSTQENKPITVGFLGKVYCLFTEDSLRKKMKKGKNQK